MNQQEECFAFIEKQIKDPFKNKILQTLNKIEESSNKEYWDAPCIGKFPEDSERWSMWWQNSKQHISIDFYPDDPKFDIFWFERDRIKNISIADECTINDIPNDLIQKILKIKQKNKEKEDE